MKRIILGLLSIIVLCAATLFALDYWRNPGSDATATAVTDKAAQIARGKYLTTIADCMACHTARGGAAYAGGRAIPTPFGKLYTPNLTPDPQTGLGTWNADDFWRAMHNGKSKDGQFLYPAFPYTEYTRITRSDADAMFAYLKTVAPVTQTNKEHELRFPYNQRVLLAGWRALYFRAGVLQVEPEKSAQWNRGAYVVQGLGHCTACHTNRNTLGATDTTSDLAGGLIPSLGWYAPSLTSDKEAGLGDWQQEHIVALLKTGVSPRATVFGPMAEVVGRSLQYLSDEDADAIAVYLQSLPQTSVVNPSAEMQVKPEQAEAVLKQGAKLYDDHCVKCHQANGRGQPPAYPPLAGNRSITMNSSVNAVRIVLNGGFAPSTLGNPRPYGMPPYGPELSDAEVAAVVSFIRNAWGNKAPLVSPLQVRLYRGVPVE